MVGENKPMMPSMTFPTLSDVLFVGPSGMRLSKISPNMLPRSRLALGTGLELSAAESDPYTRKTKKKRVDIWNDGIHYDHAYEHQELP